MDPKDFSDEETRKFVEYTRDLMEQQGLPRDYCDEHLMRFISMTPEQRLEEARRVFEKYEREFHEATAELN